MAEHTTHEDAGSSSFHFGKLGNLGLLVGGIALLLGLGVILGGDTALSREMTSSWLWGWSVFMAMTLGCFGLTLLHHTVRGSWGQAVLRIFEAGGGALALFTMALLFIPVAMNFTVPYGGWFPMDPTDKIVVAKELWLNPLGFGVRFVIYFLIWIGLAWGLRKSSIRQDESGDLREQQRRTNWSAPGLVIFVLTITLASTDWFMSMDPHWFSTIFGPLYMIVGANMALAFGTLLVCLNAKKAPFDGIISKNLTRDLGNLCFAFTMLWIYFSLSQFLIIWSGNLPEFTSFYYKRQYESKFLLGLGAVNVVFGWFIPWLTLLAPRVKAGAQRLAMVCVVLIGMRFVDLYWTNMPFMRGGDVLPQWTDIVAILAIGGIWLWAFGKTTTQASILPKHDTRLQEALQHEHA